MTLNDLKNKVDKALNEWWCHLDVLKTYQYKFLKACILARKNFGERYISEDLLILSKESFDQKIETVADCEKSSVERKIAKALLTIGQLQVMKNVLSMTTEQNDDVIAKFSQLEIPEIEPMEEDGGDSMSLEIKMPPLKKDQWLISHEKSANSTEDSEVDSNFPKKMNTVSRHSWLMIRASNSSKISSPIISSRVHSTGAGNSVITEMKNILQSNNSNWIRTVDTSDLIHQPTDRFSTDDMYYNTHSCHPKEYEPKSEYKWERNKYMHKRLERREELRTMHSDRDEDFGDVYRHKRCHSTIPPSSTSSEEEFAEDVRKKSRSSNTPVPSSGSSVEIVDMEDIDSSDDCSNKEVSSNLFPEKLTKYSKNVWLMSNCSNKQKKTQSVQIRTANTDAVDSVLTKMKNIQKSDPNSWRLQSKECDVNMDDDDDSYQPKWNFFKQFDPSKFNYVDRLRLRPSTQIKDRLINKYERINNSSASRTSINGDLSKINCLRRPPGDLDYTRKEQVADALNKIKNMSITEYKERFLSKKV